MRINGLFALVCVLLVAVACGGDSPSSGRTESGDQDAARRLAVADSLPGWPAPAAAKPVVLYVDMSQSMRGFLDPDFPTREPTDYRRVIDVIDAELAPTPINGFGNQVRVAGETALGTLGDKGIYTDGNTEMEQVFPRIRADSLLDTTHIVIGDGRRADPNRANEQYVRMRNLAAEWIHRGGTFAVAASKAPFKPVETDPSGCQSRRRDDEDEEGEHVNGEHEGSAQGGARCPLYAFAFIAPGEQTRVVAALSGVFEHVFVAPVPAVADSLVRLRAESSSGGVYLEPRWTHTAAGAVVARARGLKATNDPLTAAIILTDSTSPAGRAAVTALRGQALHAELFVRRLDTASAATWQPAREKGGLILPTTDPYHPRFITHGQGAEPYLYRIDLVPVGPPSWLDEFDAENANDAVRTYGLGRLIEVFQARSGARPVLRAYVVVN